MFLMLMAFFIFYLASPSFRKRMRTKPFPKIIISVFVLSLMLASLSVATVWTPHPYSDPVFREQNAEGNYEGILPWSKLSWPLYLSVYHTPFIELFFAEPLAYGQARFITLFAGAKLVTITGTFSFVYTIYGAAPLYYNIDFIFSDSPAFFSFLIAIFTLLNIGGALLGIIFGRLLYGTLHKNVAKV